MPVKGLPQEAPLDASSVPRYTEPILPVAAWGPSLMKIVELRLHTLRVSRIYRTHVAAAGGPPEGKDGSLYYVMEVVGGDGCIGLGEISDMEESWNAPAAEELGTGLRQLLIGANPSDHRQLLDRVRDEIVTTLHPELARMVRSAVETALLDLIARTAGLPLYDLLGGRCRRRVAVTWVAYIRGLEDLEAELGDRLSAGFQAFKLKVGADVEQDCERVGLARRLAGPNVHLRLDASGSWGTHQEALDAMHRFAELGADAVETPLAIVARSIAKDRPELVNAAPAEAAEALHRLRMAAPLPLIEHVADFDDAFALALIARQSVDAINVVPVQAGGLLRAQRLLQLAEAGGVPALLGSTVELGIGTAAAVHLAAATAPVTWSSDLVGPGLLCGDIVTPTFTYADGSLAVPAGPGLGIDLDPDLLLRYTATQP